MSSTSWVFLHGTPLSPAVWAGVEQFLRPAAAVLAPTLVPLAEGRGDVVDELASTVLAALPRTGDVHLVGHSFGGQVALEVALRAGSSISTLTMLCSRDTPFPTFARAADGLRHGRLPDVDLTLSRWFRSDELDRGGPVVDLARRCLRQADAGSWARCLDAIATFDSTAAVGSLSVPVHLVAAELDQVSTVAAMSDLASRLARAHLTVLPQAAHLSPFLRPRNLVRVLVRGVSEFETTARRPEARPPVGRSARGRATHPRAPRDLGRQD